jgi:glycosyltransferase involved in cell wall biosynthesis
MKPLVSVIIPTFNRAKTIARTIDSILLQTYDNLEIIIVEDGSKDETMSILGQFNDKRLTVICHDVNKGVTAAKNTGLNNMHGEWFTILDSDDEIVPEALETMMRIPLEKDTTVNAISCNCIDTYTGNFTGKGLVFDQYVDFIKLIQDCRGEYWGLTKTELLLNDRFNERLAGYEGTLWLKINERAKRFYIHKALRIYHTEGDDRVSNSTPSIKKVSNHYQALSKEIYYLEILKKYLPGTFRKDCFRAVIYLVADNKREQARFYYYYLRKIKNINIYKVISFFVYYSNSFLITVGIKCMKKINLLR